MLLLFHCRPCGGSAAPPRGYRAAEAGVHGPVHPGRVHHKEAGLL